jgi:hypothetical protein
VLVPYATYNETVFTLFSRRATESICFVQAADGFQRTAAALYEGNVHPRLSRKETKDLQKSMFSTLDELYAAGGEKPECGSAPSFDLYRRSTVTPAHG